jgi:hypothetical protein
MYALVAVSSTPGVYHTNHEEINKEILSLRIGVGYMIGDYEVFLIRNNET